MDFWTLNARVNYSNFEQNKLIKIRKNQWEE